MEAYVADGLAGVIVAGIPVSAPARLLRVRIDRP